MEDGQFNDSLSEMLFSQWKDTTSDFDLTQITSFMMDKETEQHDI